MKKLIAVILFLLPILTWAQYNREKLTRLMTSENERTWSVSGVNVDRPEKKITFARNFSARIEAGGGNSKSVNWSLSSSDEIRWFLKLGDQNYELIVSYDKKGNEYLKLTHQTAKGLSDYDMKLTTTPKEEPAKKNKK